MSTYTIKGANASTENHILGMLGVQVGDEINDNQLVILEDAGYLFDDDSYLMDYQEMEDRNWFDQ